MGRTDKISERQITVLIFLSLLSPLIRILPRSTVALGGKPSWLSPVPAAIVGVLYILLMDWFFKKRTLGEGLGELLGKSIGKFGGNVFSILCALWMTFYAGFIARSAAERLLSAVYGEGGTEIFVIISLILAVIAAAGPTKNLARTAEIIMPIIITVLIFAVAFSVTDIKLNYLFPITHLDAGAIVLGGLPIVDIFGFWVFFAFLLGYADRTKDGVKHGIRWLLILSLSALGVMLVTVGGCSAELSGKLQQPFFAMIRNIQVLGIIERVEALVIAIWVMTDFTMLAAALMIAAEIWKQVLGVRKRRIFVFPSAALSCACAFLIAPNAFRLQWWSELGIPLVNLVFAFILIPLALIIGKLRRKI